MAVKRGDIITVAVAGDYGKPHPAVIVQSDLMIDSGAQSVILCLLTSHIVPVETFRMTLQPTPTNGLQKPSQIMIDKMFTASYSKIGNVIGKLSKQQKQELDRKLAFVIGLV